MSRVWHAQTIITHHRHGTSFTLEEGIVAMIVIGIIRDFNNYHVVLQNFNLWHGSLEFIIYSKHNSVQKEK